MGNGLGEMVEKFDRGEGRQTIKCDDPDMHEFQNVIIPFGVGFFPAVGYGIIDIDYHEHTITVAPVSDE